MLILLHLEFLDKYGEELVYKDDLIDKNKSEAPVWPTLKIERIKQNSLKFSERMQ